MKPSEYNYIIPFGNKTIFFNGITESFFCVSNENADKYAQILKYPESHKEYFDQFLAKMSNDGFIIDDDDNEWDKIEKKYHSNLKPEQYYLMILPTYQCNLRCWYCVQEHQNIRLNRDSISKIKLLIHNKLKNEDIKNFNLAWFGGEPIIEYDTVVEITRYAQNISKELGKVFTCSITTNSTLLNHDRIRTLKEIGVTDYQITIDGTKEYHNKVKIIEGKSAYDIAIDNINEIAKDSYCNLRYNYTKENLDAEGIIADLKSGLNEDVLKNIHFSLYKVWQEDYTKIDNEIVNRLFKLSSELGLSPQLQRVGVCYADQIHFDCVFPNGTVGKCDNQSPCTVPGHISEKGEVVWNEDCLKYISRHLFDDLQKECQKCTYLPICWGPCVLHRENSLRNNGTINCTFRNKHESMTRFIQNICQTILQNTPDEIK